ncbi:MAG: hypothetical protein LC808_00485 [Actinobacteria bacterium]|nr:hypothetical protein [Actinomycetota bacterium]
MAQRTDPHPAPYTTEDAEDAAENQRWERILARPDVQEAIRAWGERVGWPGFLV